MIVREAARVERTRQQALRNAERQAKDAAKAAARQYLGSRAEQADYLIHAIQDREAAISELLSGGLAQTPEINLLSRQKQFVPGKFDNKWQSPLPNYADFTPTGPGFLARLIPGSARRYMTRVIDGKRRFKAAEAEYKSSRHEQATAFGIFEAEEDARQAALARENADVREAQAALETCQHAAVISYSHLLFEKNLVGEPDAVSAEIGYSADSRHLVVDLELPELSVVPEETSFRYVKSGDKIEPVSRPIAKRKALYAHLLSQVALKSIDIVFRGFPGGVVECLTLNGMLDTIDPATGQQVRVCLLSVRVTADTFRTLNLGQVQPEHCLRSLKAVVSRAPAELLSVKPLIELDMVDPRFVETLDVMSGLDHRPNLMELSPTEFEGLITNLFAAMGLDTRQTRPSHDGGVDCVAFDPRPVFGGKVVIQAKRYKNTVGVSAVRDLFGTVQNEGASKGILVTTSGYGKASFDFARGKPLELLDGGNLLYLLAEHAGVDARIVMPDGWADLPLHGE